MSIHDRDYYRQWWADKLAREEGDSSPRIRKIWKGKERAKQSESGLPLLLIIEVIVGLATFAIGMHWAARHLLYVP